MTGEVFHAGYSHYHHDSRPSGALGPAVGATCRGLGVRWLVASCLGSAERHCYGLSAGCGEAGLGEVIGGLTSHPEGGGAPGLCVPGRGRGLA